MKIIIKVGNVLDESADVLISTANPWLNLSGGVNGAIREAVGPEIQTELHDYLRQRGESAVPAGTVVRSNPYNLPFKHVLHAVAIDPFYDSSAELVASTFANAIDMAIELQARTIASPALATGYGPLSISEFGSAIGIVIDSPSYGNVISLKLVLRRDEQANELHAALSRAGITSVEFEQPNH